MAKKTKSYSQVQATDALEQLVQNRTSAQVFVYDLLRIFAGYGDGQIRRTKEGPGNLAKDGETILIKNLIAYRPAAVNTLDGNCSAMYDIINAMRNDAKIVKHSPRLYITSNGAYVVAYDPKENDWYENSIDLLWKDFEFFTPLAGIEKIQFTQEAEADVKSAELMAKLFDDIRRYNDIRDPQTVHALNVFMSRLLFCFFAEDTGLFPEDNLFTNTLKTRDFDPKNIVLLAKSIPQRVIYLLRFEDEAMLAVYHTKLFTTPWQPLDNVALPLEGLSLDAFWQNIVAFVGELDVAEGNSLSEQIHIDEERTKLMRQIESLERLMRSTSQPRRQRELYSEIKKLKTELDG